MTCRGQRSRTRGFLLCIFVEPLVRLEWSPFGRDRGWVLRLEGIVGGLVIADSLDLPQDTQILSR